MTVAEYIAVGMLAAISLFFFCAPLVFRSADERGSLFMGVVFAVMAAVMAIVFYVGPHLTRWAF